MDEMHRIVLRDDKMIGKKEKSTYYYSYNKDQNADESVFQKAWEVYNKYGLSELIRKVYNLSRHKLKYFSHKLYYETLNRYFVLDGKKYHYFINRYNALNSERAVEIPFTIEFLKQNRYKQKRVLEIGNVLSHYFDFDHKIVDKYEKENFVDNIDIIDFSPKEKYQIIISVSTIEHVGFDEPIKEVGKSKKAIQKIISLLDRGGIALITVPLRYNPEIDSIIQNKEIKFSKTYFLKRYSNFNLWKQTSMKDAMQHVYGSRYPAANAVAFLIYHKSS